MGERREEGRRCEPRLLVLVLFAALLFVAFRAPRATAQTVTPTQTPTATPTVTPTSCRGDLPVVEPVTSPTNELEQVIRFCGRIVGASSMSVLNPPFPAPSVTFSAGCTLPCVGGNSSCNQATVQLVANQANVITVCQNNAECGGGGCVTVDGLGNPLVIQQIQLTPTPTWTPSATPTHTGGRPAVPVVSSPVSPAGIAMVVLLLVAMVWFLLARVPGR
jgi:hypothetical protein